MQPRHLLTFIFLIFFFTAFSQSKEPFKSIGKKAKIATLTDNKYDEFFDDDSIQLIGTALININTMKLVRLELTKQEQRQFDNSASARFLSVDPLENKFAWYTPYQYAGNTPIQATDLDGKEEYHYTFSLDKQSKTILQTATVQYYTKNTFLFWSWKDKIPERYVVDFNGNKYYIGFAGAKGAANDGMQNLFKSLINSTKFDAKVIPIIFYSSEESSKFYYSHQADQLKQAAFNYLATGVLTGYVPTNEGFRMVGNNGTQLNSKTLWQETNSSARIDVENPPPGYRPGSLHYQDENGTKFQYNVNDGKFYGYNADTKEFDSQAPKVNELLKRKDFENAVNKGLKYLNEEKTQK